ncbi:helix-turn-helix domain-containing protein [Oceanithermus sp.]|uniref:winged helix-turn-helix transcriptional regulator n=1 Tax=Oceanithermus sp. TaxID=2268145 RepID=UPI00257B33CF|nr:helix-turn-helix domain-containing protein [Oceanithermus sp.]
MNVTTSEPIEAALALLGRQGTYRVLRALLGGPMRFGELQSVTRLLPRTLSLRLKEMDAMGWVVREQFAEVPPRVEYRLTPAAEALEPLLRAVETWAKDHA